METFVLVIIVLVVLGLCSAPVLKEMFIKNALRSSELFKDIEDDLSYEEVCEIMDAEAVSKKEIKIGFRRKQLQCVWDFEEVNGKMYKLVVNFEQDLLMSKDIICD